MLSAFDILLICVALILMIAGLSRRWSAWRAGRWEGHSGDWAGLIIYLLGHGKILRVLGRGIAHLIVFWGFLVPLIVIILAQFAFRLPPVPSQMLSLLMDVLGIGLLAGTLFFLIRRIVSRDPLGPKRTVVPLIILLGILLTGFFAEGARLRIVHPEFAWSSPLGWMLSLGLPASPLLMQVMIRTHFLAVLLLIAVIPFTFFRHLAAAPLNVFYRRREGRGKLRDVSLENGPLGANTIKDFSWKQLLDAEACVSCGRCEENCPAYISGKPLSPRKIIRDILEEAESMIRRDKGTGHGFVRPLTSRITEDEIWSCTTCMACVEHCPVFIEPLDKIIDMRRHLVMGRGSLPLEARPMIRSLEIFGDVQGKGVAHRMDWALNREVPLFNSGDQRQEVLFWVGCSGAFHPRYQEVSRALVHIFKSAGVNFGILGKEELCCGDPARRVGEEGLFMELARKNIRSFRDLGVEKIVTLCPHCLNTLKNEYPRIDGDLQGEENRNIQVLHATEYVWNLITEGRVSPKYPVGKSTAIQDPCYLGRVNGIYGPPRDIIRSLPSTRLRELRRHHESGFCCGGGGGGMWLHERLGRRLNAIRAEEVKEAGVDLLGTACPYCLTMLDDGLKALEMERPAKVMDVIEMVALSIGYNSLR